MNRRSLLYLIGGATVGGGGYAYYNDLVDIAGLRDKIPSGGQEAGGSDKFVQGFSTGLGFEQIEFKRVISENSMAGWR